MPDKSAMNSVRIGTWGTGRILADRNLKATHDGVGHRARLRQKLAENGGEALHDHELVEYLLALAIPRRDTKPLAKALLREFDGIGGLMAADWQADRKSTRLNSSH